MRIRPQEFIDDVRSSMRGGSGDVLIQHVHKEGLPEKCRLFARITLEPGCSIGHHVHQNETEYYVIIQGTATVNDDGVLTDVEAGDVIVTPDGYGHSIENTGSTTMVMLAVIILD